MTAEQYALWIRQLRWDEWEGHITHAEKVRREDRLWDRIYDEGGRELVHQVEAALTQTPQQRSA